MKNPEHLEHFKDSSALLFLVLLVAVDLIFIFLHFLWGATPLLNNNLFSLALDFGYPEIYQYVKEFWIIVLILFVYVKTKEGGYIAWAMLFTYLLCDDSMLIHEQVGLVIANKLEFTPLFGLRLQDYGELIVTAVSTAIPLTLVGCFYLRGSSTFKKISRDLLLLLIITAVFGIFVDMAIVSLKPGMAVYLLLEILEDGGEMVAISLITWYAFLLNNRKGFLDLSLCGLVWAALTQKYR